MLAAGRMPFRRLNSDQWRDGCIAECRTIQRMEPRAKPQSRFVLRLWSVLSSRRGPIWRADRAPEPCWAGEELTSRLGPHRPLSFVDCASLLTHASHGIVATSPPAYVTRRAKMRMSIRPGRKCTEPSAKTVLAPAG